jgi:hypothetical protein
MNDPFVSIRQEMEEIRQKQQELLIENRHGNHREWWKLQIVWEYLRDKLKTNPPERLH